MIRRFITAVAAALAAAALTVVSVLPASARPAHPNVFIVNEHGKITTPCVVFAGETLNGVGLVSGSYTITSVTPAGPVDRVTLSRAVPAGVLDFQA